MKTKKCNGCKIRKPVSEFHRAKNTLNGYCPRCKECANKYYREVYHKYRVKKSLRSKVYYLENKSIIIDKVSRYEKERRKKDPGYVAKRNMRGTLWRLLKNRRGKTEQVLGYTREELLSRLGDMSGRQLDHLVPVSWFLDGTPPRIINSLCNLHAVTPEENREKANRYCHKISKEYFALIEQYIKPKYINLIKEKL